MLPYVFKQKCLVKQPANMRVHLTFRIRFQKKLTLTILFYENSYLI